MRIDKYLTINNFSESRNKAVNLLLSGLVKVNGITITKPSFEVTENDSITVTEQKQYVARSAYKLITAIKKFDLSFEGKTVVDLGASTGGFCEVMLEHNVKEIYAVDVGTNQLHRKILNNKAVINFENTNARYINSNTFPKTIDLITCDLSFISLKLILKSAYDTLKFNGEFICLIKPQFEAGAKFLTKKGVVKDKTIRAMIVYEISLMALEVGFDIIDVCFSGLEGESGNIEYLMYMIKRTKKNGITPTEVKFKILNGEK